MTILGIGALLIGSLVIGSAGAHAAPLRCRMPRLSSRTTCGIRPSIIFPSTAIRPPISPPSDPPRPFIQTSVPASGTAARSAFPTH